MTMHQLRTYRIEKDRRPTESLLPITVSRRVCDERGGGGRAFTMRGHQDDLQGSINAQHSAAQCYLGHLET